MVCATSALIQTSLNKVSPRRNTLLRARYGLELNLEHLVKVRASPWFEGINWASLWRRQAVEAGELEEAELAEKSGKVQEGEDM